MYLSILSTLAKNFSWRGLAIAILSLALMGVSASNYLRGVEIRELKVSVLQKEVGIQDRDRSLKDLRAAIAEQNALVQKFAEASKELEENARLVLSEAKKDRTVYVTKAEKVLVATPSSPNDCRAAEDLLDKAIEENVK